MKKEIGECNHCKKKFNYYLIHNGFNETTYAYCSKCGMTTFLHEYYSAIPQQCKTFFKKKDGYEKISKELEPFLEHCKCGGKFTRVAKPRCPICNSYLSARYATKYIEANAEGTKKGWRWQMGWNGLYAIVIENKKVGNNWRKRGHPLKNPGTHHLKNPGTHHLIPRRVYENKRTGVESIIK